ncbi:hypothetical protein WMF26_18450 [Sorangium sp. So ce185]|uniref:hypothetical protein n=1 Tax=Sorangium sp. So ce185 TaxID=3133287 RepID=UPI003F5E75C9
MGHARRFLAAALIPAAAAVAAACGAPVEGPQGSSQAAGSSGSGAGGVSAGSTGAGGAGTEGTGAAGAGVGGAGAGGAGAGGSCIPFSEPPGAACSPGLQCKSTAMSCACSGTDTLCSSSQTGQQNDVHPPKSPPPEGGCCDTEGLVCGYETCGPICRCTNGAWSCQAPDVCPPFECPADPSQLDGQRCEQLLGQVCARCSPPWSCTCELQPTGAAVWACVEIPC